MTSPTHQDFLPQSNIKTIQSITGSFLHYARAIDSTILLAVNEISTSQAKPTTYTKEEYQQLMDYVATHPNAYVRYYASNMVLWADSDAAYLVIANARSRISGYYQCNEHPTKGLNLITNRPVLVECKAIKRVVSSAAEAETAGVFYNAQIAVQIRHILQSLNHLQPLTPIKTNNSTAHSFVTNNIHKRSLNPRI